MSEEKYQLPQNLLITKEERELEEMSIEERKQRGWKISHGFGYGTVNTNGEFYLYFDKNGKIDTKYKNVD